MPSNLLYYVLVGALWGCSNPFLKRATQFPDENTRNSVFETLRLFIQNPHALIPFFINQCGSLLFYYVLATGDVTAASIICNSITFAFTGITAWCLGEQIHSFQFLIIGVLLVLFGTIICYHSSTYE